MKDTECNGNSSYVDVAYSHQNIRNRGCIKTEHPLSNNDKIGVFVDDTPGLNRDEVRMHYNGAPELQLRASRRLLVSFY